MTTKEQAIKHFVKVTRGLSPTEIERMAAMDTHQRAKYIVGLHTKQIQQEIDSLSANLRYKSGSAAKQDRLRILELTRMKYE
jgi:hypothetical protein